MSLFESEIVQQEAKNLFQDYQSLVQLGSRYGKFDREGKKLYIEQMKDIMDRYKIFMKRFELADDFTAKVSVEQLKTYLSQFGMNQTQMFEQMQMTLDRMEAELERSA